MNGFVILTELDGTALYLTTGPRHWVTVDEGTASWARHPIRTFHFYRHARTFIRRELSGGRALTIPGGRPRIISARAAGLR